MSIKGRRKSSSSVLPTSQQHTHPQHHDTTKKPPRGRWQILAFLLILSVLYFIGSNIFKSQTPEVKQIHSNEVVTEEDIKLSVIVPIQPLSIDSPSQQQRQHHEQQEQFIKDTMKTFVKAIRIEPFQVQLIFVVSKRDDQHLHKIIRAYTISLPQLLTVETILLDDDVEFSNVKAINHAVTSAKHNVLLFYPFGTRHLLSEREERIEESSHHSWLKELASSQIKETFKTITGALIYMNDEIHSAGLGVAFSGKDKPTLYHRYEGYSPLYKPALKKQSSHPEAKTKDAVVAVNLPGMIISRALFQELKGFDPTMEKFETYAAADLCVRAFEQGTHVLYNPSYLNHYTMSTKLSQSERQIGYSNDSLKLSEEESKIVELFQERHGSFLDQFIKQNMDTSSKIVWDFGAGSCTGWFIEATEYCVSLENRVNMRIIVNKNDLCKGLPQSTIKALDRMISRDLHNIDIFVSHKPPERYPKFPYNGMVQIEGIPKFVVGRSMYESVSLPPKWAEIIHNKVNEVWVPSRFLEEAFIADGVDQEKVVRVPEPIDINFYDPQITQPLYTNSMPGSKLRGFNFVSVFKWEPRKGPEELLEAYFTTFTKDDDVSLHLVTYIYMDPRGREKRRVLEVIDELIDRLKLDRNKLPTYDVITDTIATTDMPRLYKSFDAFVLPSKGEGWGLPYIEAMAMRLPTIGTRYGGQLDFMNDQNSYLVDVAYMEKNRDWGQEFQIVPKISIESLKKKLKHVFKNKEDGKRVGLRARENIKEGFSSQVISDFVINEVLRVEKLIATKAK
jgi:glycosyltransferase involved in cell wall biosynthesis